MGRLLFASALAAAAMSALAVIIPFNAYVVLALVLLMVLFACIFLSNIKFLNRYTPIVLVALVTVQYMCLVLHLKVNPVLSLDGHQVEITGVVVKEPEYYADYVVYTLETDSIQLPDAPQKFKLRVISNSGLGADIYDQIYAKVGFYKFDDDKFRHYSDGVFLGAYILDNAQITQVIKKPLYYKAVEFRRNIKEKLYNTLSYDTASLLSGITLGDTSGISDSIYSNLKTSGVLHVMSVSGLHLAILCQTLLVLLNKAGLAKRMSAVIGIFAVVAIMAVTGFSASVVRSGITYLIMLIGLIIARKPDPLNSLGAAVLAVLAINPFSVTDVSFLLSVSATFGLIVISPIMYNWAALRIKLNGWLRKIIMANILIVCQSMAAVIVTIPITIVVFGEVSIIAPITNVVVNYPVFLALICTVAAAIFFAVPFASFVAYPLLFISALCAKLIIKLTEIFGSSVFTIRASNEYIRLWVAATLLVIAVYLLIKRDKFRLRLALILSAFMLVCSSLVYSVANKGVTEIGVINHNQATAVAISRNGHAVLIGSGSGKSEKYRIMEYLKQKNVSRLDVLILPCLEQNYAGGGIHLLESVSANNIIIPSRGRYHKFYSLLEGSDVYDGDNLCISLWDDVKINTIRNSEYGNSLYISIDNTTILICAPSADLNDLPGDFRNADVVISSTAVPEGLHNNDNATVLVCGERSKAVAAGYALAERGIEPYIVSDYTAVELKTRGNPNDIKLYSMSNVP